MPTGMHVYREIAARHGVDPKDEEAITEFFEDKVQCLPAEEQAAIIDELLARDGEVSSEPEPPRKYRSGAPIPKLSESPEATLPGNRK